MQSRSQTMRCPTRYGTMVKIHTHPLLVHHGPMAVRESLSARRQYSFDTRYLVRNGCAVYCCVLLRKYHTAVLRFAMMLLTATSIRSNAIVGHIVFTRYGTAAQVWSGNTCDTIINGMLDSNQAGQRRSFGDCVITYHLSLLQRALRVRTGIYVRTAGRDSQRNARKESRTALLY